MFVVLFLLLFVISIGVGAFMYVKINSEKEPEPETTSGKESPQVNDLSEPKPEPVDCKYEWSDWSKCLTECGPGTISRTLKITEKPQNGGKRCPPLTETSPCPNSKPCVPIDCKGEWDKTTGGLILDYGDSAFYNVTDKKQCVYAKRYIHKQKAKYGGKECVLPDRYPLIPIFEERFRPAPGFRGGGWLTYGPKVDKNDECPLTATWDPPETVFDGTLNLSNF